LSLTAAHLDALLAAGATGEQIVALVKADMVEREAKLEARRGKDAERQRRQRSRGVTRTDRDGDGLSPLKVSPTPPSSNPPISPVVSSETTPPAQNDDEPVKPEHVIEAWNAMAETCGLPKARMTPGRRTKLKTFVKRNTVDDITEAIWRIPSSDFLCGRNGRDWRADLDFLLTPSKFPKILEGSYG
jgi:hypothetical protein